MRANEQQMAVMLSWDAGIEAFPHTRRIGGMTEWEFWMRTSYLPMMTQVWFARVDTFEELFAKVDEERAIAVGRLNYRYADDLHFTRHKDHLREIVQHLVDALRRTATVAENENPPREQGIGDGGQLVLNLDVM